MVLILVILIILSFMLALYSMKDFQLPKEISRLIDSRRIRGTILFFKDRVEHYSSKSSSSVSGR